MVEFARGIINNYFSVVGAQVISIPLSLLYLSLITRIMGPVNYGRFMLFLASFQFFYNIFINWVRSGTIRFGAEEFTKHNKLNRTLSVQLLNLFFVVSFSSMLMLIFRKNIADFTGLAPETCLYLIVFMIFYTIFNFICQLLQATHQMQRYGLSLILRQVIILGLVLLFFVFRMRLAPLSLVLIESVSYFLVILIVVFTVWNSRYFTPIVLNRGMLFKVLRYSWPMMILFSLGYFSLWADTLLIRFFLNFESVGKYQAANGLIQDISNIILPISIIAFPVAVSIKTKGREDLIFKYVQRVIPQASFFWGLFIMLIMLGSGFIFKVVFGNQYAGSVLAFQVLLIGLSFQFLSVMHSALLQSYDFTQELLYISAVNVTLNLSGDLLLIPRMGIIGAALSKSLSFTVCGLLYMYRIIKRANIKGNTYKNSIFSLALPLLLLVCFVSTGNFAVRVLLTGLGISISYFFAKGIKLFSIEDMNLIRQLHMPDYMKLFFENLYKLFI